MAGAKVFICMSYVCDRAFGSRKEMLLHFLSEHDEVQDIRREVMEDGKLIQSNCYFGVGIW